MVVVAARTARKPVSKPSTKTGAKAKAPARSKTESKSDSKLRQASAAVWATHRGDIIAVGFILAGLVAACGIWVDVAGPFGAGLRIAAGALIGSVRAVAPIALVGIGVMLLRGPRPSNTPTDGAQGDAIIDGDSNPARSELVLAVRLGIGTALMLLSVTSLLHITLGRPGITDFDDLAGAGGALGLAVGGSLAAAMGGWGAGLVMSAFGLLGAVVLTRVSLRAWARRVDGAKLKAGLSRIIGSFTANRPTPNAPVEPNPGPEGSEPSAAEVVVIPAPLPEPEPESSAAPSPPAPEPASSPPPLRFRA